MEKEPKFTPEEIKKEKSRAVSDTNLIRRGAKITTDDEGGVHLEVTEEQKESAHREMEYLINDKEKAKQEIINFLKKGNFSLANDIRIRWNVPDDFLESTEAKEATERALVKNLEKCLENEAYENDVFGLILYFKAPISKEAEELATKYVIKNFIEKGINKEFFAKTFGLKLDLKGRDDLFAEMISLMNKTDSPFPLGLKWNEFSYRHEVLQKLKDDETLEEYYVEEINRLLNEATTIFNFSEKQKQELFAKVLVSILKRSFHRVSKAGSGEHLYYGSNADPDAVSAILLFMKKNNLKVEFSLEIKDDVIIKLTEGIIMTYFSEQVIDRHGNRKDEQLKRLSVVLDLIKTFEIETDVIEGIVIKAATNSLRGYSYIGDYKERLKALSETFTKFGVSVEDFEKSVLGQSGFKWGDNGRALN